MSRWPPRRLSHSDTTSLVLVAQGLEDPPPDILWYEVAPLALLAARPYWKTLEDAMAIAGLAVAKAITAYDSARGANFATLALTIVRNDLASAARAKARQDGYSKTSSRVMSLEGVLEDDLDGYSQMPRVEPLLPLEDDSWVIEQALGQMPRGRLRHVLLLRQKGLTQQSIGYIIGVSQNRVSQLLQEAMAAVRPIIKTLVGEQ